VACGLVPVVCLLWACLNVNEALMRGTCPHTHMHTHTHACHTRQPQVLELLEHCKALNAEVEELQRDGLALRRKVKDLEQEGAADFGRHGRGGPMMHDMGMHGMMPGGWRAPCAVVRGCCGA